MSFPLCAVLNRCDQMARSSFWRNQFNHLEEAFGAKVGIIQLKQVKAVFMRQVINYQNFAKH